MNLRITKNKEEANLITHDGKFHPDDVFSTVFMSKYIDNPCLYRIGVGEVKDTNAIVYDVGFGKFDHHGPDAKKRPNSNLKYCSFGLLFYNKKSYYLASLFNPYLRLNFSTRPVLETAIPSFPPL